MALEKIQGTQIVTWAPPLPQRAFRITAAGVSSDNTYIGGLTTDGKRYGYYVLDTSIWQTIEGLHQPPMQPGEQFQLWTGSTPSLPNFPFDSPPPFSKGSVAHQQNTTAGDTDAPDLWCISALLIPPPAATGNNLPPNRDGEPNGFVPLYYIKNAQVCTVAAVQQAASNQWYVYFSPPLDNTTINTTSDGIITLPKPYNPKYLGQIGHVGGVNYTYSIPGGPDQLTCILQVEPDYRTDALDPGRIVTAHRGGNCIWEGQLTEPAPAATGWTLTANGVGTYGTNFGAWWDQSVGNAGWTSDAPVDFAIARGLRWNNRGIGKPAGIYTGPVQNPGSLSVTDFMNLLCTGGSLLWELVQPAGASSWPPAPWEVTVYDIPTDQDGNPLVAGPSNKTQTNLLIGGKWKRTDLLTSSGRRPPDLMLVNTSPVARTITADYNTLILYYQLTPDKTATSTTAATAATYATTFVDVPGSVVKHGRMEYYLDISNAGAMSSSAAQAIGLNVLTKYIRANFSGSFSVMPGQLLNPGGVPVDLGLNWNGAVVTVQGVNAAQGGEVGLAPLTFIIGQYAYDDDTQTATVTPYQNALTDLDSVVAALYPGKFA